MRICVIIASLGRPQELAQLSKHLQQQTRLPDEVVFSVVSEKDLPDRSLLYKKCKILMGDKGLPAQRNLGMVPMLENSDVIVFFDDDYIPTPNTLENIEAFFLNNQDCVGVTGHLIADGINSAGISYEEAVQKVNTYNPHEDVKHFTRKTLKGLYGCNMAYRTSAILEIRFDENLPLYGWQEDIDFAAGLLGRGKLAKTTLFAGVHRGAKGARTSGVKLGYSQVANPLYLAKKGTMRRGYAMKIIFKNMMANHMKALKPEPWIDRGGRVKGNWLALKESFTGEAKPNRILDL